MKYLIDCNTTDGPATVELEERTPELAALSAIELLFCERFTILPHQVVRIFVQEDGVLKKLRLSERERARVDWLSSALLGHSAPTRKFIVAGVYEGTNDRYATTVFAANESEALLRAFHDCSEANNGWHDPLSVLAIFEGDHKMLDCQYSQDQYVDFTGEREEDFHARMRKALGIAVEDEQEEDEEPDGDEVVLSRFTVFSTQGTHHLLAPSALDAEHMVSARRVAGVVAGHVQNRLGDVRPWVSTWAYDKGKSAFLKRASVRMSSEHDD